MTSEKVIVNTPGLSTLLTVAFVVLKLCGVISWSWWWVLSPIWIPALIVILFIVLILLLAILFD